MNAGVGGTSIVKAEIDGDTDAVGPTSTVLDLPLPDSTESFPKLSNDEAWLTFTARRSQPIQRTVAGGPTNIDRHLFPDASPPPKGPLHLYLWRVGTDAETAVRLTNGPANASWPDVFVPPREETPPPDADAGRDSDAEGPPTSSPASPRDDARARAASSFASPRRTFPFEMSRAA